MNNDTQLAIFAVLLYVVIILYIYGMYRMTEINRTNLRGSIEF
jgi:hypothetical protein